MEPAGCRSRALYLNLNLKPRTTMASVCWECAANCRQMRRITVHWLARLGESSFKFIDQSLDFSQTETISIPV